MAQNHLRNHTTNKDRLGLIDQMDHVYNKKYSKQTKQTSQMIHMDHIYHVDQMDDKGYKF